MCVVVLCAMVAMCVFTMCALGVNVLGLAFPRKQQSDTHCEHMNWGSVCVCVLMGGIGWQISNLSATFLSPQRVFFSASLINLLPSWLRPSMLPFSFAPGLHHRASPLAQILIEPGTEDFFSSTDRNYETLASHQPVSTRYIQRFYANHHAKAMDCDLER